MMPFENRERISGSFFDVEYSRAGLVRLLAKTHTFIHSASCLGLPVKTKQHMKQKFQNYSNHRHIVPFFHYATFLAILVLIWGSVRLIITNNNSQELLPWLFLLLVLTLTSIGLHSRSFALKAQDRAIRAEETLRYFLLTGKRLDQSLTIYQVIALRFASDDEFVGLVEKALTENLSPRDIKKSIRNWKPDFHRA
jgi:hypothetical protein